MSRSNLRRQLFQRNCDYYIYPETLETVEEEPSNRPQEQQEQVTDLDATYLDDVHNADKNWNQEKDSILHHSPVCKPKRVSHKRHAEIINSIGSDGEGDNDSTFLDVWDQTENTEQPISSLHDRRDTPRKPRQKVAPLVMQHPDCSPSSADRTFTFSPIHRSSARASCKDLIRTRHQSCHHGNRVRALPVSPALFASPTMSTPVPNTMDINTPSCHSIMEHNDSVFSFTECNMCRICHEDGSKEKLISPCHCAGTMGMLHLSCLGKWLGSSKTTKCEICDFQFVVKKKSHPLRWYMKEPSLEDDRKLMMKDVLLTVCSGFLVLIISVLCMVFALRFKAQQKSGPASVLVLLTLCCVMLFIAWTFEAIKRMRKRLKAWHNEHHVIEIEQENDNRNNVEHTPLQRFSVRLPKNEDSAQKTKPNNNLLSSTYISYSLESYKAAMFNPVTPDEPLLQDINNNDITLLHESSPSVISLDEMLEESVSYYQPPECGTTSILNIESGHLLKETGV